MKKELPNKKREWVRLILSALVLFAMVPITILAIPKVMALTQPHTRELLQRQLESLGIGGWVAFLGIQVIQVVVAMIPDR